MSESCIPLTGSSGCYPRLGGGTRPWNAVRLLCSILNALMSRELTRDGNIFFCIMGMSSPRHIVGRHVIQIPHISGRTVLSWSGLWGIRSHFMNRLQGSNSPTPFTNTNASSKSNFIISLISVSVHFKPDKYTKPRRTTRGISSHNNQNFQLQYPQTLPT